MSRRRKKIPEGTFETTIESLSHDGRGIAHIDGKTTFIRNALPGEKIIFKYTNMRGSFNAGVATEILSASSERVKSLCTHADMCGGCCLQHLKTEAQLKHKQQVMLEMLQHFGKVVPQEILPPLVGNNYSYRHKARLGVKHVEQKGDVLVGFREQNGRYISEILNCQILHPSVSDKIPLLRKLITSLTSLRVIPQIEVAVGDQQTALIIRHLKPLPLIDLEKIIVFAKQQKLEIYLQPKGPNTIHKIWPENNDNKLSYTLPDHEIKLQFHPTDFTQVNPEINRQMINQAIELLDPQPDDEILDLFCGLGNFTIPLAKHCKRITGIEGSKQMVERSYENAALNNIKNIDFYEFNLKNDFTNYDWAKKYNKILIDPPRSGAAEIVAKIKKFNPEKIIYISCNPATFARDAGELVNNQGYKLTKVGMMDMFPHTAHVETMGLFVQ
jgi:23S rRNA (uracil1939-C5)-methyltransferase